MKILKSISFAFCLVVVSVQGSSSQSGALTVIHADRLIDGTGSPSLLDAQILIRDDRILKVGKVGSFAVPSEARRVDASGKTLLPGFLDLHFHMEGHPQWARQFLANGITSVRDPGAWMEYFEPLKQ